MIYQKSSPVPMHYHVRYSDSFGDKISRFAVVDDYGNFVFLDNDQVIQGWRFSRA